MAERLFWAPAAWIAGRWQARVLLVADAQGRWARIEPGTEPPAGAEQLTAPVLPALVDAHSHAFQRAFVGLAERRETEHDDFWSWRDRMYDVALRIGPQALRAVAAHLYSELLAGGYTQVCEFHYLHHAPDGSPWPEPATMSLALADAAADAGIGLTLLPTLYERAGFQADGLRDDQRRFRTTVDEVLALQRALATRAGLLLNVGAALHSLRAVRPDSLRRLADAADGPLHIHVAEQPAEVRDCLAATGARPIDWLLQHAGLDARWQLVHATHSTPDEVAGVARTGAGVVICPATEANLGDGVCDLDGWLAAGVPLSVGSDSQVVRGWSEELRWLDYGQRLVHGRRNVSALPGAQPATAARLFDRMLAGGAAAAGFGRWGLQVGARADLLVVDTDEPALAGVPGDHLLDALVFAAPARPFARVLVAGDWARLHDDGLRLRLADAMNGMWSQPANSRSEQFGHG